jgi:hypothetical protein
LPYGVRISADIGKELFGAGAKAGEILLDPRLVSGPELTTDRRDEDRPNDGNDRDRDEDLGEAEASFQFSPCPHRPLPGSSLPEIDEACRSLVTASLAACANSY